MRMILEKFRQNLTFSPRKMLQWWRNRKYKKKYNISDEIEFINVGTTFHGGGSITIGRNTYLSNDSKIVCHPECSVTIGENTAIGDRVRIYTRNKIADLDMGEHSIAALEPDCFRYGDVSIGDNCWIGAQVSVIEGTTIGDNTTVGTHSIVTRDLPPHCVAAGNPAKVVKFKPHLSPAEVKQFSSEYPGVVDDSVRDKFL